MLIEFNFSNFASYLDNANFSMKASSNKEFKELNTFENEHGEFLKSALVYGANGSGKSNLVKAIAYMKDMVMLSFENEEIVKNCNRFLFSSETKYIPSHFEAVFVVNENGKEIMYKYGFE